MGGQNRVKWAQLLIGLRSKKNWGLIIATNSFAFVVKAILGLESTHLESQVAKLGLNALMTIRV